MLTRIQMLLEISEDSMFLIVVSLEERPCMMNGVEIWPAQAFLKRLWDGKVV